MTSVYTVNAWVTIDPRYDDKNQKIGLVVMEITPSSDKPDPRVLHPDARNLYRQFIFQHLEHLPHLTSVVDFRIMWGDEILLDFEDTKFGENL